MTASDLVGVPPRIKPAGGLEPLLVNASEAARLCGVSRAKWFQMSSAGQCPRAINLGIRCPRWRRQELIAWCEAGCPKLGAWEAPTRKEGSSP